MYAGVNEYTDDRTATLRYAFLCSMMNLGIVAGAAASPLVRQSWAKRVEGADVATHPMAGITGAFWSFIGVTALVLIVGLLRERPGRCPSRICASSYSSSCGGGATSAAAAGRPKWWAL